MTESSRPSAQEPPANDTPERVAAPNLGRRIGLAVYFVLLAYVCTVPFVSITSQVFATPTDTVQAASEGISCSDGANTLAERLRTHSASRFAGTARSSDKAFFEAWDSAHKALVPRCETSAFEDLVRLRHHLEITLRRFDREEGALFERLLGESGASPRIAP